MVAPTMTMIFMVGEPSIREKRRPPTRPTTAPITLPERTRSTVQPDGLPARSSLRRIRSAVSAPEKRRPSFVARLSNGSRMRSANGRSSWSLSSLGAFVIASRTARDRMTPPWPVGLNAEASRTMASTTRATPRTKRMAISHLHLDQSTHPEDPDAEDGDGPREHRPAEGLPEHHDHIVVVRQEKVDH